MMEHVCICRTGQVRSVNQDRADCFSLEKWSLAFVADGMGGHFGGEQASETVAQACAGWWDSFVNADQRPGFLQSVEQVRGLLRRCHEDIAAIVPPGTVCGTTAVLLWIAGDEYALFSVGDSRCYAVTRRFGFAQTPVQLTHDDVSAEPQFAGKLFRALGPGVCTFSLKTGAARPGMVFALCSDGVYKSCPGLLRELKRIAPKGPLESAAARITAQVDGSGAPDNYSLVLLRV